MAELIEERQEELEEEATLTTEAEVPEEEPQEELPEKYRGKSLQDIARMHQEAERHMGRQSAEVGELRAQVDQIIKAQLNQAPKEPEEEPDFFLEPDKAINRAIESHPKIKQAEEAARSYQKQSALAQLERNHPDMKEVLQDPSFAEWVGKSTVRQKMFVEADQNYDYEKANELFSLWKERKELASRTVEVEKASRKQQVAQATTGSVRGSVEPPSRKVYRRADIMKLMKEDPVRYEAMGDEILKAYAEGRVK